MARNSYDVPELQRLDARVKSVELGLLLTEVFVVDSSQACVAQRIGQLTMPTMINERKVGPIIMLELGERLTIEGVGELREKVESLVADGHTALLLDCSQVTAIDSQGLGALVRTWVSLNHRGGKLKLIHSVRMREVFEITGLQKVIECFDDVGSALRSF